MVEKADGYWSHLLMRPADLDIQPAVDKFNADYKIPQHKKAWIGVTGRTWSTISAPPSVLAKLVENCEEVKALPGMTLPVRGAVHAGHLPNILYDDVVKPSFIWDLPVHEKAAIMSTNSAVPYPQLPLRECMRLMTPDVIQGQLRVDKTFVGTVERLKEIGLPVEFSVCGPSAQTGAFLKLLKASKLPLKMVERPHFDAYGAPQRGGTGAIAIVGMAGRFPGSNEMDTFWKTMMDGSVFVEKVPENRFKLEEFYDPTGKKRNCMVTTDGCFIEDPGSFDAKLFKMSPREVMHMDPVHRLLLMVTHEALEKAGHNPENTLGEVARRTSVWFGQNADVWREIDAQQGVDVYTAPGLLRAFSPGRVNYHFGFEGGSYSLDAACSSSSTTIQLACAALENRDCDMAVAGGAQIASNPFEFSALGKSGFLSKGGGCKTFRAEADGYCRGEAVGVVVLKRLEDAIADNDNIESIITGWGRNYSADASSITHPHPQSQAKLYGQVLRQANRKPSDIGYVELHGTGTIAGDLSEMTLVTSVFNGHHTAQKPLHVGALKANFGHSEAAAGVSSTIKAAMMAKRGICPPQACITPETNFHPGFKNLDMTSIKIDMEPAVIEKRNIMVNNFDAAGGNTCLLIEAPPQLPPKSADPRSHHTVTVSARTNNSLKGNKERLLEYLEANPDVPVADVAYSTTARRMHHPLKVAYVASSSDDLAGQLRKELGKTASKDIKVPGKPGTVFMFTGQGSHYAGMGAAMYSGSAFFKYKLDYLQEQTLHMGFPRFIDIITNPDADMSQLSTVQVQLAIVALEVALAETWISWGVKPSMVTGHSLGEYAALAVAGVLATSDMLWLVGTRATMLQTRCTKDEYGMLALQASASEVDAMLKDGGFEGDLEHACFNGPKSNVVSGPVARLAELETAVKAKGLRAKLLPVPYAFHSAQLDAIFDEYKAAAEVMPFHAPSIPVASTLTGQVVDKEGVFNAEYLARHARQPVRFVDALHNIQRTKTKNQAPFMWMEIGPSPICAALLRETLDTPAAELLVSMKSGEPNWKSTSTALARAYAAGLHVNWAEYHRHHAGSVTFVDLPTYAFDLKPFWKTYTMETALAAGVPMADNGGAAVKAITAGPSGCCPSCGGAGNGKFRPTALVQTIEKEDIGKDKIEVVFKSTLADERFRNVLKGHDIEGTAICPASAWVDMAATAAKYVHSHALPDKKSLGTIADLELVNPLVLKDASVTQNIEIRVVAEAKDNWTAHVTFRSQTGDKGAKFDDNGKCKVESVDPASRKAEFAAQGAAAKKRVETLMAKNGGSFVHHMKHNIMYQLFNSTVRYDKRFQAAQEAFIDYDSQDAVSVVKLTKTPAADVNAFLLNPYHSDSLVHLPGFMLNTGRDDSEDVLFFSSGIKGMMLADDFTEDKTYYCYTSMVTDSKGVASGDIFLLNDKKDLVGVVNGVKFHQMRRQVLKMSLQLAGGASAASTGRSAPSAGAAKKSKAAASAASKKVVKKVAVAKPAAQKKTMSMADVFLDALMSETGLTPEDLDDATLLTELGVDSLMGMAVLQRVQNVTGEALAATIFFELQTVGDVKAHLGEQMVSCSSGPATEEEEIEVDEEIEELETVEVEQAADIAAPAELAAPEPQAQPAAATPDVAAGPMSIGDCFINALISQTGIDPADLDDATMLTELGVDSLMGMAILQEVQNVTGETLPATIFFELQTIGDVKEHLGGDVDTSSVDESPDMTPSESLSESTSVSSVADPDEVPKPTDLAQLTEEYTSNAVLLQGDSKSTQRPLFFVAGSSGAASIYAKIPKLDAGLPVYALEFPFLMCPDEMHYRPEDIAPVYLAAIKNIQKEGPYLIGGYSAGAVHAYEIARLLLEAGEQVDHLLLSDMKAHCPGETWTEPPAMEDQEAAGSSIKAVDKQVGNRNRSADLAKKQRYASLQCMYNWKPTPMSADKQPKYGTTMIWAKSGMCERFKIPGMEADPSIDCMDAESRSYKNWFYSRRSTYGAHGWDVLCGPVECHVMDGDHWNMLEPPHVSFPMINSSCELRTRSLTRRFPTGCQARRTHEPGHCPSAVRIFDIELVRDTGEENDDTTPRMREVVLRAV